MTSPTPPAIAFIGGGNMASALIGGLIRAGRAPDAILVIEPGDAPRARLVADKDTAVPPQSSRDAARVLPMAQVLELPGLGHLAHEEDAARVAQIILSVLKVG